MLDNLLSFEILTPIPQSPFKLERDLQRIFEKNLEIIANLLFIKTEFTVNNRRIDTLAFDQTTNSFVIIEYKRDRNYSVADQVNVYMGLADIFRTDFLYAYSESMKKFFNSSSIDWSQTRVMIVAPGFTQFQKESASAGNLRLELWEVIKFQNDTISINNLSKATSLLYQIGSLNVSKPLPTTLPRLPTLERLIVGEEGFEVVNNLDLTIDSYLSDKSQENIILYNALKAEILNINANIILVQKRQYISFNLEGKVILGVYIMKQARSGLKIWINKRFGTLNDPNGISRDMSNVGHWGVGDYQISYKRAEDLSNMMAMVRQSIETK